MTTLGQATIKSTDLGSGMAGGGSVDAKYNDLLMDDILYELERTMLNQLSTKSLLIDRGGVVDFQNALVKNFYYEITSLNYRKINGGVIDVGEITVDRFRAGTTPNTFSVNEQQIQSSLPTHWSAPMSIGPFPLQVGTRRVTIYRMHPTGAAAEPLCPETLESLWMPIYAQTTVMQMEWQSDKGRTRAYLDGQRWVSRGAKSVFDGNGDTWVAIEIPDGTNPIRLVAPLRSSFQLSSLDGSSDTFEMEGCPFLQGSPTSAVLSTQLPMTVWLVGAPLALGCSGRIYSFGQRALWPERGVRLGLQTASPVATLDVNATDAAALPAGLTTQRPVPVKDGMLRYNRDLSTFEMTSELAWVPLVSQAYLENRNIFLGDSDIRLGDANTNVQASLWGLGGLRLGAGDPEDAASQFTVTLQPTGPLEISGDTRIAGDLEVTGALNVIERNLLQVSDLRVQLGTLAAEEGGPLMNDRQQDGGGLELAPIPSLESHDKSLRWFVSPYGGTDPGAVDRYIQALPTFGKKTEGSRWVLRGGDLFLERTVRKASGETQTLAFGFVMTEDERLAVVKVKGPPAVNGVVADPLAARAATVEPLFVFGTAQP